MHYIGRKQIIRAASAFELLLPECLSSLPPFSHPHVFGKVFLHSYLPSIFLYSDNQLFSGDALAGLDDSKSTGMNIGESESSVVAFTESGTALLLRSLVICYTSFCTTILSRPEPLEALVQLVLVLNASILVMMDFGTV